MIKEAMDRLLSKGSITQEGYDKLAVFGMPNIIAAINKAAPTIKTIGMGIGLGAGGLAVGKELFIDPIIASQKVNKSFSDMRLKVPQLASKTDEEIQDYFNVIKTFSPRAASNPLVAGALINKMIEFGGVDHKLVQDIASIQSGASSGSSVGTFIEQGVKSLATGAKGGPAATPTVSFGDSY